MVGDSVRMRGIFVAHKKYTSRAAGQGRENAARLLRTSEPCLQQHTSRHGRVGAAHSKHALIRQFV